MSPNAKERENDDLGPLRTVHLTWCRFTESVHNFISQFLVKLSVLSARNAKVTIVFIPLLSVSLALAGFFTNFHLVVDEYEVFAPQNCPSALHREWITTSGFTSDRPPISFVIYDAYSSTASNTNLLGREGMRSVFDAINTVRETPGYDEICELSDYVEPWSRETSCQIVAATRFWNHDEAHFESVVHSDQDVNDTLSSVSYPNGAAADLSLVANVSEYYSVDGQRVIQSVGAYFVNIYLPQTEGIEDFEKEILDRVFALRKDWECDVQRTIQVEVFSGRSFSDEYTRAIFTDLPLVPFVACLMTIFTCFVFFRRDPVESRTFLGIASIISISLSIMSGFGTMFLIGVPYTNSTTILPFIVYGVGLDDTFIITGHYLQNINDRNRKDPIERLAVTISSVGMSIFVTTLTTSLAFLFGLISSIPSVSWICIYAFPTIVFVFLYQITFFTAILILDEERVLSKKRDYIYRCCRSATETTKTDIIISSNGKNITDEIAQTFLNKNENVNYNKDQEQSLSPLQEEQNDTKGFAIESVMQKEVIDDENISVGYKNNKSTTVEHVVENTNEDAVEISSGGSSDSISLPERFMIWYTEKLMRKWVKIFVIITFLAYLGGSAYSMTLLKQRFSWEDLLPADSYVLSFMRMYEEKTDRLTFSSVYFRNVDQSNPEIQEQMVHYIDDLSSLKNIEEPPFCWVRDYNTILNDERYKLILQNLNFNEQLDLMLRLPEFKEVYGRDIQRDNITGEVISSRCILYIVDLDMNVVDNTIDFLHEQETVGQEQPINSNNAGDWSFFVYDDLFLMFEFFSVHVNELISSTVQAIIAVTVVGFIFLPHWSAVFFIFTLMVILYVDLLGTIRFFGVYMNVVTYVALVISIGLLVDFIMHILLRYYESTQKTREDRVKDTLRTLGSSVLVGGISTFLGVLPLVLSTSYVLRTICACFFATVVLGVSHGLIFLPVLLSIFGPANNSDENTKPSATIEGAQQLQQNKDQHEEVVIISERAALDI